MTNNIKLRRPKISSSIIITLGGIAILLFQGCASQRKVSKDGKILSGNEEKVKPLVLKEFVLGYGDIIDITVWKREDLSKRILIGPSGVISYPFLGNLKVTGLTIHQLRDKIISTLAEYFKNPVVTVNITSNQSQKVFVLGEVRRPGVFQMAGPTFALEAISMAGGFTLDANENDVLLIRGAKENQPKPRLLDLMASLEDGDIAQNAYLQPGDVLYIPTTTIASVDRLFQRVYNIVRPLFTIEYGIVLEPYAEEAITGKAQKSPNGRQQDLNLIINP